MKTNSQQKHECEYTDPKEFIPHPIRKDRLIDFEDKPKHVQEAINSAFDITPYPVLPIVYADILVDGVVKKGFIDGGNRIRKAIEYGFDLVPAVKIDITEADTKDDYKAIIANLNYHNGLTYEQGKIADNMWSKIRAGQGKRTDLDKEETVKADKLIAAYLGIKPSKALRVRMVYQRDPDLLKQVDEDESYSLSSAYNAVKKDRKLTKKQWEAKIEDEEEETVAGCNVIEDAADDATTVEDENPDPAIDDDINDNTNPSETTSNEIYELDTNMGAVEGNGELSDDGSYVLADCPCCNSELIIYLKK